MYCSYWLRITGEESNLKRVYVSLTALYVILRNPNSNNDELSFSKDEILISIEHSKESNTLRDWSKRISGEYPDMTFQYRELRPYTAPFYSVIQNRTEIHKG